jgi:hypothetical protein
VREVGSNRVHRNDRFGSRAHKHDDPPWGETARSELCQRATPAWPQAIHNTGQ